MTGHNVKLRLGAVVRAWNTGQLAPRELSFLLALSRLYDEIGLHHRGDYR